MDSFEHETRRASNCRSSEPGAFPVHKPEEFLALTIKDHDVLFYGTKHDCPAALCDLTRMLPLLVKAGLTHVGLEISKDQQPRIDRFMREGAGLEDIEIFHAIDCPEYRSLLESMREIRVEAVALDLPRSMWHTRCGRDEWMAREIESIFCRAPSSKMLMIVGNLHALKRVDWVSPDMEDTFIRGHLVRLAPELKAYSVLMEHCDFLIRNCAQAAPHEQAKPFIVETRGAEFKPSALRLLAVKPMRAHEVADALIAF